MRLLWKSCCWKAMRACAGASAAGRFDLIICDVGLPDGNGFDFCGHVRKSSNVLFLFLTARDEEIDIVQGYEAGADGYVTKPFSLMVLIAKVNAMLGRVQQAASRAVRSGGITLYPEEKRAEKDGVPLGLTNNEWQLLSLFSGIPATSCPSGSCWTPCGTRTATMPTTTPWPSIFAGCGKN